MKKRRSYLIFALCLTFVWQGCSSEHVEMEPTPSVPIYLGAVAVNNNIKTRATMGADEHNSGLPIGSEIDVFIYDSSAKPVPSMSDSDEPGPQVTLPMVYITTEAPDPETTQAALNLKNASVASPAYPNDGDNSAYIFAVWPAKATASEANDDSYTFTIKDDQCSATNVTASDLMATDNIIQPRTGGKAIDLPMTHCMAKVIVRFNPTGNLTSSNMPTEFTALNIKNSVTIKPKTGATSTTNSGLAAITTNSTTTTIQCSTEQAFLIPPQTINADTTFLQFDISGTESDHFSPITGATFKPSQDITFEANTVYEITVNVNVNYITATATITPWNSEDMTFDKYIL